MKANLPVERTPLGTDAHQETAVFNIVILHDDVAAGQRAMGSLGRLASRFRVDDAKLRPQFWRFDLLQDADWFALALADAANADLLVFAASSASGLPVTVENWLKRCLARKRGSSAAVVALLPAEGNPETEESASLRCLQGVANDAGLRFVASEFWREEPPEPLAKSLPCRTNTVTLGRSFSRENASRINSIFSRVCSYHHGGLNE